MLHLCSVIKQQQNNKWKGMEMVTITKYRDKYNPRKIWLIKKSSCSHYYINQVIEGKHTTKHKELLKGKRYYKGYTRVTKQFIKNIGIFDMERID